MKHREQNTLYPILRGEFLALSRLMLCLPSSLPQIKAFSLSEASKNCFLDMRHLWGKGNSATVRTLLNVKIFLLIRKVEFQKVKKK